jgi:hypothetical protein
MQYRQSSRASCAVLATALAGVVLFGALAYLVEPQAAAVPEPLLVAAPHTGRCANCGWIEAKHELVPLLADPQALRVYEYTLRMEDGSMSLFRETLPTTWRLGERVILIEASGALD